MIHLAEGVTICRRGGGIVGILGIVGIVGMMGIGRIVGIIRIVGIVGIVGMMGIARIVEAKSEDDFTAWLENAKQAKQKAALENAALLDQTLPKEELMVLGEQVYMANCAACHQVTGMGLPGVFPALKGSPIVLGDIKEHINVLLLGRPGTAMQSFAKQLSIKQLEAVITYKRNAWGNDTGDVVQPSEIQAALDANAEEN